MRPSSSYMMTNEPSTTSRNYLNPSATSSDNPSHNSSAASKNSRNSPPLLSNIIFDYVGSPKTERRRLLLDPDPSRDRQAAPVRVVPVSAPSSAPSLGFRHSSSLQRNQSYSPSPSPTSPSPHRSFSPRITAERIALSPPCRPHSLPRSTTAPMAIPRSLSSTISSQLRPGGHSSSAQSSSGPGRTPRSEHQICSPATQPSPGGIPEALEEATCFDDDELSLPFAVDSDEDSFRKPRETLPMALDPASQSGSSIRQLSHDAALGVLVRTLKSAPPLKSGMLQINSSRDFLLARGMAEVSLAFSGLESPGRGTAGSHGNDDVTCLMAGPAPSLTASRRRSPEVLEELKLYSELKDTLLRQRGDFRKS